MLLLQNIHKSYRVGSRSEHVLRGVDLEVATGELVAIMGSSGSGKSTLLNIIGILDRPDSGHYLLEGRTIDALSEKHAAELRNRHIGFVFQSFNLIGFKTALENVALPLYYQRIGRRKRNAMAQRQLERLGLGEWADHLPSEMSGGQRQRVAIARAMVTDPSILLADEPTGALDSETSMEVMGIFKELNRDGKTIMIVTHEHDIAAETRRIISIRDGVITARAMENVQP